jgi:two-component sensor histidine kinase
MPTTKQHIAAARKVYENYWESYSKGDLEAFVLTLDETYEIIGTSESEIFHTTGLGLSITNDIVKAHGGKLNISSSPGGTIFKILLNK